MRLYDLIGPAIRSFFYNRDNNDADQHLLLEDFFGYNVIYFSKEVHIRALGEAFFLDGEERKGFDSVEAAIDEILKLLDIKHREPNFIAYGCAIRKSNSMYIANEVRDGTEIRAGESESFCKLLRTLKVKRDKTLKVHVHVGLAKTGTTFLQKRIFPHLKGTHYVEWNSYFFSLQFQKLKYMNQTIHEDEIKSAFEDYLFSFDEDNLLISDESLTKPWDRGRSVSGSLLAIKRLFPEAHILISIREQTALLRSLYLQSLRQGWTLSPASFLRYKVDKFVDIDFDEFRYIEIRYFDYRYLLKTLRGLFDSVTVLLYEELLSSPSGFIASLAEKVGSQYPDDLNIPKQHDNRAIGLLGFYLLRFFNVIPLGRFRHKIVKATIEIDNMAYISFEPFPDYLLSAISSYFAEPQSPVGERSC